MESEEIKRIGEQRRERERRGERRNERGDERREEERKEGRAEREREKKRTRREERGGGEAEAGAGRMYRRNSCRRTGGQAANTTR